MEKRRQKRVLFLISLQLLRWTFQLVVKSSFMPSHYSTAMFSPCSWGMMNSICAGWKSPCNPAICFIFSFLLFSISVSENCLSRELVGKEFSACLYLFHLFRSMYWTCRNHLQLGLVLHHSLTYIFWRPFNVTSIHCCWLFHFVFVVDTGRVTAMIS